MATLQRIVFPLDRDPDLLPLYAEGTPGRSRETAGLKPGDVIEPPGGQRATQVLSRRSYRVFAGERTSFATYFNAFPAAYWATHTNITEVRLRLRLTGSGTILLSRSNAKGHGFRIDSNTVSGAHDEEVTFDLKLDTFGDGGWYWFDLLATDEDLVLEEASWETEQELPRAGSRATVAITTYNRPLDCVKLLSDLGAEEGIGEFVKEVLVMDQGDQKVKDQPAFAAAEEALGGKLRVIEQANLGGSGGFSRGMFEAVEGGSEYVLLLDDDVMIEPEAVRRAVTFASATTEPAIVGGQMFSMYERTKLHAHAEVVDRSVLLWKLAPGTKPNHDFSLESLRATPWLHERADADYNGWWMCLIPTEVIKRIGLSLPVFIKWDDAEYGLRAQDAGIKVITLPGVALWHVPWSAKDDSLDWQAFFHHRNRLLAALLHSSPSARSGVLFRSFAIMVRFIVSSQYSVAHLQQLAMRDLLAGPEGLHAALLTDPGRVRRARQRFTDAQVKPRLDELPKPVGGRLPGLIVRSTAKSGTAKKALTAAKALSRQFLPVKSQAREHPQVLVPFPAQRWWILAGLDSAVVTNSDGSGFSLYQRDQKRAKTQVQIGIALHREFYQRWEELSRTYRDQMRQMTGPQAWAKTFGVEVDEEKWQSTAD